MTRRTNHPRHADLHTILSAQGFMFPHGGDPSSVGRNLFGGPPDQTDSPRSGTTAAAAQPDLRRGLADLKAASADGSLRRGWHF